MAAGALGAVVALLFAVVRWSESRSILQPSRQDVRIPDNYHPKPRDVFLDTGTGVVHGWFFDVDKNAPTILYIHGNADTIAQRLPVIGGYLRLGLNVFIYDPHGYGKSEGRANRSNFVSDAFAAYLYLTEDLRMSPKKIVVLGQSLGGVPALRMANSEPVAGVILEGTFVSIRAMVRDLYPRLPVWLLASAGFDNGREIRKLKIPVLLINGTMDATVAPHHSQRLFDLAPEPREYLRVEGAGHTTMFETAPDAYYGAIDRFVRNAVFPAPGHRP